MLIPKTSTKNESFPLDGLTKIPEERFFKKIPKNLQFH